MMDQNIKTKWIEALRSGERQQARRKLRIRDSMCCLGVLCDVFDPTGWRVLRDINDDNKECQAYGNEIHEISVAMREQLGITDVQVNTLIKMNDHEERRFPEIADWIEENL